PEALIKDHEVGSLQQRSRQKQTAAFAVRESPACLADHLHQARRHPVEQFAQSQFTAERLGFDQILLPRRPGASHQQVERECPGEAELTVANYRIKTPKPSSQAWKTFLYNHDSRLIGIDFFTVPTETFRNLYCFIILLHERRQVAISAPNR